VTAGGQGQIDEVRSGGSYISQSDFRLHFGLGKAASANLSIRRLDGKMENFSAVCCRTGRNHPGGKDIIKKQPFTSGKP
jgi:enediyne biosynthesis protein E4